MGEKFRGFRRFSMKRESFPNVSFEQWPSLALSFNTH